MEFVRISPDHHGFALATSHRPFIPWGNNYAVNRLVVGGGGAVDWARIARDFDDFKKMRANVARIHLQVPHFMDGPQNPSAHALAELSHLLRLAAHKGIYLDVTGLASYNIHDRAAWYDALSEKKRWAAQACFWSAVSKTCAKSPAVFCYDLINEPVIGGNPKTGWYAGRMGDYEFVQTLSFNPDHQPQAEIARKWTRLMISAIRQNDSVHPITIGMLPAWGVPPKAVAPMLDFIAVHIYPQAGKVPAALETLKRFEFGKPIVIEETFPLSCGVNDERDFLLKSRGLAAGWLGQYPEQTPDQLLALQRAGKITLPQSMYLAWIQLFQQIGPEMLR